MSYAPSERFNIKLNGFSVFDLKNEYAIDVNDFASMGRCTPYEGKRVFGKCLANVIDDKIVFLDEDIYAKEK